MASRLVSGFFFKMFNLRFLFNFVNSPCPTNSWQGQHYRPSTPSPMSPHIKQDFPLIPCGPNNDPITTIKSGLGPETELFIRIRKIEVTKNMH